MDLPCRPQTPPEHSGTCFTDQVFPREEDPSLSKTMHLRTNYLNFDNDASSSDANSYDYNYEFQDKNSYNDIQNQNDSFSSVEEIQSPFSDSVPYKKKPETAALSRKISNGRRESEDVFRKKNRTELLLKDVQSPHSVTLNDKGCLNQQFNQLDFNSNGMPIYAVGQISNQKQIFTPNQKRPVTQQNPKYFNEKNFKLEKWEKNNKVFQISNQIPRRKGSANPHQILPGIQILLFKPDTFSF